MEHEHITNDGYLASLLADIDALDARDAAADRKIAEGKAEKEAVAAERKTAGAALEHYRQYLAKRGAATHLAELKKELDPANGSAAFMAHAAASMAEILLNPPTPAPRVGPKHLKVLESIAEAANLGKGVTTNQISARTGLPGTRISNVIWEDTKRGFVSRSGHEYTITEKGWELLRRVGSPLALPPKDKAPATQ